MKSSSYKYSSLNRAVALKIGARYFHSISPTSGRVQTSWSLAGAKLFLFEDEKLILDFERRLAPRVVFRVVVVVDPFPDQHWVV